MTVQVKICGLNSIEAVRAAVDAGASYTGFIFYPQSLRNISTEKAAELENLVPKTIKKVAVTVDSSDEDLQKIIVALKADFLQLHGDESVERVREIKKNFRLPVIKAVKIRTQDDINTAGIFALAADILLFDAKPSGKNMLPGGNGRSFDWNLLSGHNFEIPWMLSGGLNMENIEKAVKISGAKIIDLSSSLETSPGKKSPELIKKFMEKIRGIK